MVPDDKQEILNAINGLSTKVEDVSSRVDGLSTKVESVSSRVDGLSTQVEGVSSRVDGLSTKVDTEVSSLSEQISGLSTKVDGLSTKVDTEVGSLSEQISELAGYVDKRLEQTEARMVTKEYLDEKLADLRGDLVVLTRKEDRKLVALVELLRDQSVILDADAKRILGMELFPQS